MLFLDGGKEFKAIHVRQGGICHDRIESIFAQQRQGVAPCPAEGSVPCRIKVGELGAQTRFSGCVFANEEDLLG